MRMCPICIVHNPIIHTVLEREEYTKCGNCGLLYTHADVDLSTFERYYDGDRSTGMHYQHEYIHNEEDHKRNRALAREFKVLSEESWENKYVLEVGSSAGFLLDEARMFDARVQGLEISHVAAEYAVNVLNIPTINANWELVDPTEHHWINRFDFVLMSHVVEHFVDPFGAIRKVHSVLRPGGAWITQHPDASVIPGVKFHVRDDVPKEHLQIFDGNTILHITRPCGFERVLYRQEDPGQSISIFRKVKD